MTPSAWVLDSGGAGRGAWQGGVLHEFMQWTREHGGYPLISMGASAGGYAAADVATGTEATVMKGWTAWGLEAIPDRHPLADEVASQWPPSRFRRHLHGSIRFVMSDAEVARVFDEGPPRKLLVFTARVRRRDGRRLDKADLIRLFVTAAARKFPRPLKYLPRAFEIDPVVFATNLPASLQSEYVRPLTRHNYHAVIEASCLVPVAMGPPVPPALLAPANAACPADQGAAFVDGGYALKMPMAMFEEDSRLQALGRWAGAPRTVVFCCDPRGRLWETSLRLRAVNEHPSVARALREGSLLLVYPDHTVEAGFLCLDPATTMRTFNRGREQGRRILGSDRVRRFLSGAPLD